MINHALSTMCLEWSLSTELSAMHSNQWYIIMSRSLPVITSMRLDLLYANFTYSLLSKQRLWLNTRTLRSNTMVVSIGYGRSFAHLAKQQNLLSIILCETASSNWAMSIWRQEGLFTIPPCNWHPPETRSKTMLPTSKAISLLQVETNKLKTLSMLDLLRAFWTLSSILSRFFVKLWFIMLAIHILIGNTHFSWQMFHFPFQQIIGIFQLCTFQCPNGRKSL